jgi:hypothetical protein
LLFYDRLSNNMIYTSKEFSIQQVITNPIEAYKEFRMRILLEGQLAPFPEFRPVVDYLIKELEKKEIQDLLLQHPSLRFEYIEARTFLFHVNLSFVVDEGIEYPYERPFSSPFPYRPTLDAIEQAIRFFDKINRVDPKKHAIKLYHFDRYCYHRHALFSSEEVVLLPTVEELTPVDFIKTRSVPIEFIGVVSQTLRVDGHFQSPLDFWYHDINHARRLFAYIKKRLKEQNITSHEEAIRYYTSVNLFIEQIIKPNFLDHVDLDTSDQVSLKKLCTIIIFEIVHESALTLEKEALIEDLLRGNGPQPFEYNLTRDNVSAEELRTPTGNIQSGAQHGMLDADTPTSVRYFLDNVSIGLLANVYSKLNHYYYDNSSEVDESMLPKEWRTPEKIVIAAKCILNVLGYDPLPSDDELYNLITNRDGTKERILRPAITENKSNQKEQDATDPLTADEIIKLIKLKEKKIFTLFGYSVLGYESKEEMLRVAEEELSKLSRDEWVIAIGATEEGIGACYEIAKKLSFETIGIVSTQALSYSGKFSDFVDMIYIVNDELWGGYIPGTKKIAETTKVFLSVSDYILALGGGSNTAVTLTVANEISLPFTYIPFDMNHALAEKRGIVEVKGEASSFA